MSSQSDISVQKPKNPYSNQEMTPRRRLHPGARRAQLLDHALTAFASAGIERAVHADVAQRAGVSTPTVFKYFPTREALVDAVLERVETTLAHMISVIPDGAGLSPAGLIRVLVKAVETLCETQPDLMKIALSWSVAFSSVRGRYQAFENHMLNLLKARLSTLEADRSDARILLGSAILFVRMHYDGSSPDIRQRYIERVTEVMEAAERAAET